jgi:hypothetical protein
MWWIIAFVVFLFLVLLFIGTNTILNRGADSAGHVYKAIGFGMIMVWTCIFICYFLWAVNFYNLRYGYSRKVWDKIEQAKKNRTNGKPFRQEDIDEEPKENPYKDQTFGLPTGTVRGMIAFTLLFGSIAMLIVSFGMKNEIQTNSFFVDQFDFFKTAFLMMIAFYFGNHSLKYLVPGNKPANNNPDLPSNINSNTAVPEPQSPDVVFIEPDANREATDNEKMPPISAIDPMAPQKK